MSLRHAIVYVLHPIFITVGVVGQSILPPGYNTSPDAPETVLSLTRRVFRKYDMTHD
jgi:hypothetical protein